MYISYTNPAKKAIAILHKSKFPAKKVFDFVVKNAV